MWTVWLWMTGLKHVPASRAGVFTVMLPISAAAVGVLVLGERFSTAQAAAFALALLGLLLATWPTRAQPPTDEAECLAQAPRHGSGSAGPSAGGPLGG